MEDLPNPNLTITNKNLNILTHTKLENTWTLTIEYAFKTDCNFVMTILLNQTRFIHKDYIYQPSENEQAIWKKQLVNLHSLCFIQKNASKQNTSWLQYIKRVFY
jgi:hypothetical protein